MIASKLVKRAIEWINNVQIEHVLDLNYIEFYLVTRNLCHLITKNIFIKFQKLKIAIYIY